MFKKMIKWTLAGYNWVKNNKILSLIIAYLTGVPIYNEVIQPPIEDTVKTEIVEVEAAPQDERLLGLYLVRAYWVKDILIERDGMPDLEYKDFAITTNHRLRLTAFPTIKEVSEKIGPMFDYELFAWFVDKEILKPKPAEIEIEQPEEKEKTEKEIEK